MQVHKMTVWGSHKQIQVIQSCEQETEKCRKKS